MIPFEYTGTAVRFPLRVMQIPLFEKIVEKMRGEYSEHDQGFVEVGSLNSSDELEEIDCYYTEMIDKLFNLNIPYATIENVQLNKTLTLFNGSDTSCFEIIHDMPVVDYVHISDLLGCDNISDHEKIAALQKILPIEHNWLKIHQDNQFWIKVEHEIIGKKLTQHPAFL